MTLKKLWSSQPMACCLAIPAGSAPLLPRRAQVRVQHDSPAASSAIVAGSGAEPVKSRVPHTAPGEHAVGASVKNSAPA